MVGSANPTRYLLLLMKSLEVEAPYIIFQLELEITQCKYKA
jgi:hypothetical protein